MLFIAFNHVERSPLLDQELNCNVCQLENMFQLISDQTFILKVYNGINIRPS